MPGESAEDRKDRTEDQQDDERKARDWDTKPAERTDREYHPH